MKVLLLDDNPRHRRSGIKQLEALSHEVVAFCDYGEARQCAKDQSFDVALIDLFMPAEPTTLGTEACKKYVGLEIDIGFAMVFQLTLLGIKMVAVATDKNHHDHPLSAVVDWFDLIPMKVNDAKAIIMHSPMCEDGTKNWGKVLDILINK